MVWSYWDHSAITKDEIILEVLLHNKFSLAFLTLNTKVAEIVSQRWLRFFLSCSFFVQL